VTREETARVAIRTHSEENQIESWVASSVGTSKGSHKLLLVVVRALVGIVQKVRVEFVDLSLGNGNLGEECVRTSLVVGVLVV
jgi:hypothetical protein